MLLWLQEPTEKQTNWLEERGLMTESMTKQEAWLIINNAVREARQYHKERQQARMRGYISNCLGFDDEAIMSQCGGGMADEFDDWMYQSKHGLVTQLVEQQTENLCVGGSIPPETTIWGIDVIGNHACLRNTCDEGQGSSP